MKGKDLFKKRNKDEEGLYQAILQCQSEIDKLNTHIKQFQDSLKAHEENLKELNEMTPTEWRKKNENKS